jgi:hypothetical protein
MRKNVSFPTKLYRILSDAEGSSYCDIIAWLPDGKSFKIHSEQKFCDVVMKDYFTHTNFKSLTRNLYLYGFLKTSSCPDSGVFYHPRFVRSDPLGCISIKRNQFEGDRRQSKARDPKTKRKQVEKPSTRVSSVVQKLGPRGRSLRPTRRAFASILQVPMRSFGCPIHATSDDVDAGVPSLADIIYDVCRVLDVGEGTTHSNNPQEPVELALPSAAFQAHGNADELLRNFKSKYPEQCMSLNDLLAPRPIEEMIRLPLLQRHEGSRLQSSSR